MELKLNVYKNKQIIKTYKTDTYALMFGTLEDLIDVIELDKLDNSKNESIDLDMELIKIVGKTILNSFGILKNLLKDIFEGLTDEELKYVKTSEIIKNVVEIVKYTFYEATGTNSKN